MVSVTVHVVCPRQVKVPRVNLKFIGFRVVVIIVIFTVSDVVVVDTLDDDSVAKVFINVEIFTPPVSARVLISIPPNKVRNIRPILYLGRPLIV